MSKKNLISIITPVYNTEGYINRCIDSILAQTYENFELLLIDDGTPDRAGDICDEYALKDSRIRVFHKKNEGVSIARNLALDNASGDWIAFVDSDDSVKESWLSDYVREIEKSPNAGLIYQGMIKLIDGVEYLGLPLESILFKEDEIVEAYTYLDRKVEIFGFTCSKIYRADIFQQNNFRFDENISFCEDLDLTLRFLHKVDSIAVVNKFNYIYTFDRNSSLSWVNKSYDILSNLADITNSQLEILSTRKDDISESIFDPVIQHRFRALKRLYELENDKTPKDRRRIIKTYYTQYYSDLNRLDIYGGSEKLIVKILALKAPRLIDLIYRLMFKVKSKLFKANTGR